MTRILAMGVYPALLLLVNLLIAAELFSVSYTAYLESNEGTFIAIAKQIAERPLELGWWPLWDCGMPFHNTYLPLLPLIVGAVSKLTGSPASLVFHQVCAVFYIAAPVSLYAMARGITGRAHASFWAATAFSLVSPCAFLVPAIRTDLGSVWDLRRLQIFAYYGEGPHTASLALLPLAMLFLYLALTRRRFWVQALAGVFAGAAVLSNAFAAVILVVGGVSLLFSFRLNRLPANSGILASIAIPAYLWISPLMPPSVVAAIRMNSPTVDGDYAFTSRSLMGLLLLSAIFAAARILAGRQEPALRFFTLFATAITGIVLLGTLARVYVVPQPHRYQIAMDMGLCLIAAFGGAAALRHVRQGFVIPLAVVVAVLACLQLRHSIRYANGMIRGADVTQTAPYKIAKWVDQNMDGRRVMISGSYSFHFNVFTDTPQLHGGHDPMLPNFVNRIATFTIFSGMNTGERDVEISTVWLRALGAHAISVPGPGSLEYYKPFADPRKFDGVLPVLWREGADTIYGVPARSGSLAHVIPDAAVVRRMPVNGLDTAELERYVAALDDGSLPEARLMWHGWNRAEINSRVLPGQSLSLQITHHPGWRATIGGEGIPIGRDGLGFVLLQPRCENGCTIDMRFDGGPERSLTLLASIIAMLGALCAGVYGRVRRLDYFKL